LQNEKWTGWNYYSGNKNQNKKGKGKWINHNANDHENESEWSCGVCLTGNWLSRATCRSCSTNWSTKPTANKTNKEVDKAKLEALQAALESLPDNVHTTDYRQKLTDDITRLSKSSVDNRTVAKQIVTLESWMLREEKHLYTMEDNICKYKEELDKRKDFFRLESGKMASLKEMLNKDAGEAEYVDARTENEEPSENDLIQKECEIRRQMASAKGKRAKELEKEADGLMAKIASAKRIKTNEETNENVMTDEPVAAAAAAASS
jgi:hypothetical protein